MPVPRPRRPLFVAALLGLGLAFAIVGCNQAGSQVAGKALEFAMKAAAESIPAGSGGPAGPRCPKSCDKGFVCDKPSGKCVTEQMAAALARARQEHAGDGFEVPPDPCDAGCKDGERCEYRGTTAECVAEGH